MSRPAVTRSRTTTAPAPRRGSRLRPHRKVDWLLAGLATGIVLNGFRLRDRLSCYPVLRDDMRPIEGGDEGFVFLAAEGVTLDDELRDAAVAYAGAHDLDVLELVPGDLSVERAFELARMVDPVSYRGSVLTPGRGAYQATVVHRSVLERAGIEASESLDPVEYLRVTATLKQYAPSTTDVAVAPGLHASGEDLDRRRAFLRAMYNSAEPLFSLTPLVEQAILAAGVVVSPAWGLVALAAYSAQPHVAFSGSGVRPADLSRAGAAARLPRDVWRSVRTLGGRWEPPASADDAVVDSAELRATYAELLAGGIDRFFEPRVDRCPRCAAPGPTELVRVGDLLQFKPGEFVLDECGSCGHVFQNPRLSLEGLDFYYRDFYDGLGEKELELVFSSSSEAYLGRVDLVARHTRPKHWLDVGGGHGHFCLVAAGVLPETRFDGLDLGEGIDEAARRGWVERAYRGMFPDLVGDLVGSYDVVSMHHYLEHTREPWSELDAARTALEPGGHLLVEVPDPDSRIGRRMKWLWGPWFQPQHQHFLSVDNLAAELEQRGFTVVEVERGEAHQPVDLAFALFLLMSRIAPDPAKPWLPAPTRAQRAGRAAVFTGLGPFLVAAYLLDRLLAPVVRKIPRGGNTYRLLARRE
jgi:SAM-dependent methyltransferase